MPQFAQEMTELRKAYEDYFAKAIIGLKITGSRSPVMMTRQIFLAQTNPNSSNYAGNRSLFTTLMFIHVFLTASW